MTTPAGGAGLVALTQVLQTTRTRTLDPQGTVTTLSTNPAFVIDNYPQYDNKTLSWAASEASILKTDDAPGAVESTAYKHQTISDSYVTYVVYQPTGGIWVTLASMAWSWSAAATKGTGNVWTLDAGSSPTNSPSGSNSTTLPLWGSNITSYTYH